MHFNSAKECLLKHGRIKEITRGRISGENHAFLAERLASGDSIAGYESVTSSKPTGEKVFRNASAPVSTEKVIADIGYPSRDENEFQAHVFENGKKVAVGMREVCSNPWCMASLTYCRCDSPVWRVDYDRTSPVYFTERTAPFKKDW